MSRKPLAASAQFVPCGALPDGVVCQVSMDGEGPAVFIVQHPAVAETVLAMVAAIVARQVGVDRAEDVVRTALHGG